MTGQVLPRPPGTSTYPHVSPFIVIIHPDRDPSPDLGARLSTTLRYSSYKHPKRSPYPEQPGYPDCSAHKNNKLDPVLRVKSDGYSGA